MSRQKPKLINGWTVLVMSNEINYEGCIRLKQQIEQLCQQGVEKVALDLTEVRFVGSLALGIFSFGKKLIDNQGGRFCLVGPNPAIRQTLNATQMSKIIPIVSSSQEL